MIEPWHNTSKEPKYLICNASDIGLGSWLGQGTLDRIRPARSHYRKFNPAQLSYATLQKELLAITDSLKFCEAQLRGTKFPIPTVHKPLETFIDRTQASQKLRRWPEFLASFEHAMIHTAGKENFITDAISSNYIRIGTSTDEEDFISERSDYTTLHRVPTLPTASNTITCNHFCMPPLISHMSEYQCPASDVSETDCAYNLCRSRGETAGHHRTCPYQDDDDWEQFVSYPEDTEF